MITRARALNEKAKKIITWPLDSKFEVIDLIDELPRSHKHFRSILYVLASVERVLLISVSAVHPNVPSSTAQQAATNRFPQLDILDGINVHCLLNPLTAFPLLHNNVLRGNHDLLAAATALQAPRDLRELCVKVRVVDYCFLPALAHQTQRL